MKPKRPKNSRKRKQALEHGYRSGYEHAIAKDLTERGVQFEYERTTYSYIKPVRSGLCTSCDGTNVGKRCKYTVDFDLPGKVHVEAKGRFTGADRAKLACVRTQHPEADIRLLFQQDNYTTKLKRERYSAWAHRNGFVCAVGSKVPAGWLNA